MLRPASLFILTAAALMAQSPMSDMLRLANDRNRQNLTEAVEKWHEGWLDWRPSPEVRTFREQVGHILDTNNMACSSLKGEPVAPGNTLEKSNLSKVELVAAVKKSFDDCAAVFSKMSDADFGKVLKWGPQEAPAARMALLVPYHTALHYGNLITYMRLRGMVPPETERAGQKAEPAKPEMVTHYIVFLRRGPKWTPEVTDEIRKLQAAHMDHIRKSAEEGSLRMAGPIGDGGELRGIFVFRSASLEAAKAIAEADPMVRAGRLAIEIHPWMMEKGYLP